MNVGDLVTVRVREQNKSPVPVPGMIVSKETDASGKLTFEVLVEGNTISATTLDLGPIDLIEDKARLTKKWIDLYKKSTK